MSDELKTTAETRYGIRSLIEHRGVIDDKRAESVVLKELQCIEDDFTVLLARAEKAEAVRDALVNKLDWADNIAVKSYYEKCDEVKALLARAEKAEAALHAELASKDAEIAALHELKRQLEYLYCLTKMRGTKVDS